MTGFSAFPRTEPGLPCAMSDDDGIAELEIKIAFLEKHIEGQDRAMMEMSRQLDRLQRAFEKLSQTVKNVADSGPSGPASPFDERPPHY